MATLKHGKLKLTPSESRKARLLIKAALSRYLHVGDIVKLSAGGPPMVVAAIDTNGAVTRCMWFDDDVLHNVVFPAAVLRKV